MMEAHCDSTDSSAESGGVMDSLPRSIRWRLELGLLQMPPHDDSSIQSNSLVEKILQHNASTLTKQRSRFDDLVDTHYTPHRVEEQEEPEPDTPHQDEEEATSKVELDPLTAMLVETEAKEKRRQELDLKYRKERARRKRGMTNNSHGHVDETSDVQSMFIHTHDIVTKDLNRLHPQHCTHFMSLSSSGFDNSARERSLLLEEVLLVFAMEHPRLRYRQGMHEICSYCMMVLEMDLLQQKETNQHLDDAHLQHDAFTIFEQIMDGLAFAYSDAPSTMQDMGQSILLKIQNVACDAVLYEFLKNCTIPPQLYCTKWVRLMFSREVVGWRNVLLLWDVFFAFRQSLQEVLENAAACMILLVRTKLLTSNDANDVAHLLMNLEPLEGIAPLTSALTKMMERSEEGNASGARLVVGGTIGPTAAHYEPTTKTLQQAVNGSFTFIRDALEQTIPQVPMTPPTSVEETRAFASENEAPHQGEAAVTETTTVDPLLGSVPGIQEQKHSATISSPAPSNEYHHHGNNDASLTKMFASSLRRLTTSDTVRSMLKNPMMESMETAGDQRHTNTSNISSPSRNSQMSNHEMADVLHKSVVTIQHFFIKSPQKGSTGEASVMQQEIPEAVWEALAEIETVRKSLLETAGKDGTS